MHKQESSEIYVLRAWSRRMWPDWSHSERNEGKGAEDEAKRMGQTITELTVQLRNTKLVLQAAEGHRGVDAGGW